MGPQPLSRSFLPFFHCSAPFSTVFHDFDQKRKKGVKIWRNGKGKKSVLSRFFPIPVFLHFLSWHVSIPDIG